MNCSLLLKIPVSPVFNKQKKIIAFRKFEFHDKRHDLIINVFIHADSN